MAPFKSTTPPRFRIDFSQSKYNNKYDRLMNILYFSKELPSDLFTQMNMSYDNYRKVISILGQRDLIKKISKDGIIGYQLTLKGKTITHHVLNYMKYRDCVEEETDRHWSIKRRNRKRQFSYLYALFDRMGIIYESFLKPEINNATTFGDKVFFYTALDFKRLLGIEATTFIGSRLLGFFIGRGQVIPVYRTNQMLRTFGSHEALVPEFMKRYFTVQVDTAVLICNDDQAVLDISNQILENMSTDPKDGINTARYRHFYVLPSNDKFLDHYNDLYADSTETRRIIDRYNIDTSDIDRYGRYRLKVGTGFIDDHPVLVCTGNVNIVDLKLFIRNADLSDSMSYVICKQRDLHTLQSITKDKRIKVLSI